MCVVSWGFWDVFSFATYFTQAVKNMSTRLTVYSKNEIDITCNAICPGWVRTPLVEKQIEEKAAAANSTLEEAAKLLLAEKQPSRSFVTPENLGDLTVFLCSDAGSQITGIALPIDGAWTAQ